MSNQLEQEGSPQSKLKRLRRRERRLFCYDVEVDDRREMPFVVGVLADLAGQRCSTPLPLSQRAFIEVDRDRFDEVMVCIRPRLVLKIPTPLLGENSTTTVELEFRSMNDFAPGRIVEQCQVTLQLASPGGDPEQSGIPALGTWAPSASELLLDFLGRIFSHPDFERLEAAWRGLRYLVEGAETGDNLILKVLPIAKEELSAESAGDYSHSELFKKVRHEMQQRNVGTPFRLLIGDYDFDHGPEDVSLLRWISAIAASSHAPFVAGVSPNFFGTTAFTEWKSPRDYLARLDAEEFSAWNAFRASETAGYVALTMPKVLARVAYPTSDASRPCLPYLVESIPFEKTGLEALTQFAESRGCLWMNAAWVFAVRVAEAFSQFGWFEQIVGEKHGIVDGVVSQTLRGNDSGAVNCLPQFLIPDGPDEDWSAFGFLPLVKLGQSRRVAFTRATSCRKRGSPASSSTIDSLDLDHLMNACCFAHYLIAVLRDSGISYTECGSAPGDEWKRIVIWRVNRELKSYVIHGRDDVSKDVSLDYPLDGAEVEPCGGPGTDDVLEMLVTLNIHTTKGNTGPRTFRLCSHRDGRSWRP